jgi:uncharacterized protein (TIGR02246 family)
MPNRTLVIGLMIAVVMWDARSAPTQTPSERPRAGREEQRPAEDQSIRQDHSADQAAIQGNIVRFEEAYNSRDANAIADLFTPEGRIVDKEGVQSEGREAIAQVFAHGFTAAPDSRIEVYVGSIEFLGADLAVEVGTTREVSAPEEPPAYDGYTVLHVKRDGMWQMALARDEEGPPPTGHERLQPLAWLVGEWVDDDGSSVVASTCRWSDDGNFLLQEFKLQLHGRDAMNVSQRIGWDPLTQCIRSWVFDSEGGFGESIWTREDSGWVIKATGVRPDGTIASATNHLLPTGRDGYVWQTSDRIVAGEMLPAMEVKVARKPPEPAN